ncbi:MAG: TetR/AcrR family transcriptional regulator [Clostridiales bacterium]|nr:TetR/AcrR family transcriptional regulator [Clostridiales bacterium]
MEKENVRVAMTKQMLLDGLEKCMKRKNIDKITVAELCREAKVNRATFYNHYEMPKDILIEAGMDHAKQVYEIYNADSSLSHEERVLKVLEFLYETRGHLKVVLAAGADKYLKQTSESFFLSTYFAGIDYRKELDLNDDAECRLVANMFWTSSYTILRQWLTEEDQKTPKEMLELFHKLILRKNTNRYPLWFQEGYADA